MFGSSLLGERKVEQVGVYTLLVHFHVKTMENATDRQIEHIQNYY